MIGYEHRVASEHFAAACAEVLAGNGSRGYLCDRAVPTPVISYGVVARGAAGAINITASHNPPHRIHHDGEIRLPEGFQIHPGLEMLDVSRGRIEDLHQPFSRRISAR